MDKLFYDLFLSSAGVCTDTRAIQKDSIFFCLKGENFNGNKFAKEALQKGAKHVVVDEKDAYTDTSRMTLVENCTVFLQELANYHRKKFTIPVIGITGSNGKTTTKELIHAVLDKKYNVLYTKGNLNNHLGVPFTLLELRAEHEVAIIEMGANKYKDIEELCAIAEPTHGIITNIGMAHLEGFKNFQGVLKTKKELYDAIEKNNGKIIYNNDDEVLQSILPKDTDNSSYGTNKESDVVGNLIGLTPYVQMNWSTPSHSSTTFTCKMVGKYNFYNYLAAIAFGVEFNVAFEDITNALVAYIPTNNRSQVQETEKNTLIMDCYNANPTSMKSAIESFSEINHSEKLMILGAMKELGDESQNEHNKIIEMCSRLKIHFITVGSEFNLTNDASLIQHFENADSAIKYLEENQVHGKLILLKGSRSIGLEKLQPYL